jgi:hypothetical protein
MGLLMSILFPDWDTEKHPIPTQGQRLPKSNDNISGPASICLILHSRSFHAWVMGGLKSFHSDPGHLFWQAHCGGLSATRLAIWNLFSFTLAV